MTSGTVREFRPRGRGIDGFYYREDVVNFISISRLTDLNVNSDHDPVLMNTTINGIFDGW